MNNGSLASILPLLGALFWTLLGSPSTSWAGIASDVTVVGKISDWDQKNLYLIGTNGVEFRVPRSAVPKNVNLRPNQQLELTLDVRTFQNSVYRRKTLRQK